MWYMQYTVTATVTLISYETKLLLQYQLSDVNSYTEQHTRSQNFFRGCSIFKIFLLLIVLNKFSVGFYQYFSNYFVHRGPSETLEHPPPLATDMNSEFRLFSSDSNKKNMIQLRPTKEPSHLLLRSIRFREMQHVYSQTYRFIQILPLICAVKIQLVVALQCVCSEFPVCSHFVGVYSHCVCSGFPCASLNL